MSKEYLEALNHIGTCYVANDGKELWISDNYGDDYDIVNNALQRLKAIDNTNPSEALEIIRKCENSNYLNTWYSKFIEDLKTIKQALIKSQEQEKKLAYFEKVKTMIRQKDCALRYFESEDCFAVRTIFSNGWYKLTPAFVDENVREEIEPLPIIEKNKKLREENEKYKEMLRLIKEKNVDVCFIRSGFCRDVNEYNTKIKKTYNGFYYKKYRLTQDEYNTLKEMLKCS